MMYWDGNMGVWGYIMSGLSFVLFWAAVITAIVLFARSTGARGHHYQGAPGVGAPWTGAPGAGPSGTGIAEHLLAERFARGEIDESEYNARLAVLRRGQGR